MTMAQSHAIAVSKIRKAYGPTVALSDASFAAGSGTVHALLGENGAGKSTMVKMLSGLVQPDAGEISIFGETVHFSSPRDAHRAGMQTAFQELTQVPDLTVWENMLLPYQPVGALGCSNVARGRLRSRRISKASASASSRRARRSAASTSQSGRRSRSRAR
jgi:ribose transport system ATP-binding protein